MRFPATVLSTTAALVLVTACTNGDLGSVNGNPPAARALQSSHIRHGSFVPVWSKYSSLVPVELRPSGPLATLHNGAAKPNVTTGIYVSEFDGTEILFYPNPNRHNHGPLPCMSGPTSYVNGVAVDGTGNLIDPDGGTRTIILFGGLSMCGHEYVALPDPYGQPSDAASANALTSKIVVANIFDTSGAGSVSVCGLSAGCVLNLTNPAMYEVAGVALAKNGDCWASATNSSGTATLTYFKDCNGGGQQATGYLNAYFGGLDIDKAGNLVSISAFDSELYVYKGCNPRCALVGGPFPLHNEAVYGHLDKRSLHLVAGDFALGQADVYSYQPTNVTYVYSFNTGLASSELVEGVAFDPRSKE